MSDDDLFRSGHRPSFPDEFEFQPHDSLFEPKPFVLDVTDPRWYPGHPNSIHCDTRHWPDEEARTQIQPIAPMLPLDEYWGNIDAKNPASLIAGGLIVGLVAYIFWAL